MGRVEKLVVLVVLFSITAILVISMNTGGPSQASGGDQLADSGQRRERWSPADEILGTSDENARLDEEEDSQGNTGLDATSPGTPPTAPIGSDASTETVAPAAQPGVLLSSEIDPSEASTPKPIPEGWVLRTLEGLGQTPDPEILLYTCREGETFTSLAQRFYGDPKKVDLLQRNNEGLKQLSIGRQIFVPARDDTPAAGGSDYVVLEGDNLWGIAKKLYGKGSRWEEILDANATSLPSPDALRPGMVLRIP